MRAARAWHASHPVGCRRGRRQPTCTLLCLALLAACSREPEAPSAPPPAAPARIALTSAVLGETRYLLRYDEEAWAELHEGRWRRSEPPLQVTLHPRLAHGDLDEDGVTDAAVVLLVDGGGSATFYELAAVLDQGGEPVHAASLTLGDRIDLESLEIIDGDIIVRYRGHGPEDPLCCPTQPRVRAFALSEDGLVDVTLPDEGQQSNL